MPIGQILQQPVFSRGALNAAGMSDRTIARRVKSGIFVRLGPELLTTAGREEDPHVLNVAAHLRTGAALTGPSSASFFPKGPVLEQVTQEQPWLIGRGQRRMDATFVPHPSPETINRHGVELASPRQAALDCIRVLPAQESLDLVHRCVQQKLLVLRDLENEARVLAGYKNVGRLRDAADAVRTDAHSRSEATFHALLRAAGITGWVANLWITLDGERFCIDIAFPELKLAIEYDSAFTHGSPSSFRRDRRKWNALKRAGWTVLNYTREAITDDWPNTRAEIEHFRQSLSFSPDGTSRG